MSRRRNGSRRSALCASASFDHTSTPLDFGELVPHQGAAAERALLEKSRPASMLRDLSVTDAQLIRVVLENHHRGQELDLQRFASALRRKNHRPHRRRRIGRTTRTAWQAAWLFWTKMCRAHLFHQRSHRNVFLLNQRRSLRKRMQWSTSPRLPRDLAPGRCYIPLQRLSEIKVTALRSARSVREKFRPLYDAYLTRPWGTWLPAGPYTTPCHAAFWRVRLACAWPILIGASTIKSCAGKMC